MHENRHSAQSVTACAFSAGDIFEDLALNVISNSAEIIGRVSKIHKNWSINSPLPPALAIRHPLTPLCWLLKLQTAVWGGEQPLSGRYVPSHKRAGWCREWVEPWVHSYASGPREVHYARDGLGLDTGYFSPWSKGESGSQISTLSAACCSLLGAHGKAKVIAEQFHF